MSASKKTKVEEPDGAGHAVTEEEAADGAAVVGANGKQEDQPHDGDGAEEKADWFADTSDQVDAEEALEALQKQLLEVNDEASDKVLQIEVEYNQKRQPIYRERSKLLRRLPRFWQTVLMQQETLCELIHEDDEEALFYCEDLFVEDMPDIKSGYSIVFRFRENPYFQNETLVKKFTYHDDGTAEVTGEPPVWFPGQSLTEDAAAPEVEVAPGQKRPRVRDSFFLWFEEGVPRGDATLADDPVADIIKEQIWPNPLPLYLAGHYEDCDGWEAEVEAAEMEAAGEDPDNPILLDDDEGEGGYAHEDGEEAAGGEGEQGDEEYYEEGAAGEEGAEEDGAQPEEEGGEGGNDEGHEEEAAAE